MEAVTRLGPTKRLHAVPPPLDGPQRLPRPILILTALRREPLHGDDYPLTYDADGYPELPACLDRRPKLLISEAPRKKVQDPGRIFEEERCVI
jgi:hypothetical protein